MLFLHGQLQQKLQLVYKTNITQIHQKIQLYGSQITKDLKQPHLSRLVGGAETQWHREVWRCTERQQNGQSHIHE